jgi:hypothetical protein
VFGIIDPISHKKFEDTKSDIINKMFGIASVADKKEEKRINNISKINKIIVENYNSLNSSNPVNNNISTSNNQNAVFNNTTINNYFSNGSTGNNTNISIVQISNAVQSVGKISKRGRPPKARPSYTNYSSNNFYMGGQSSNNLEVNSKLLSSTSRGSMHLSSNVFHLNQQEEISKINHSNNIQNDENKNLNDADIDFINAYIYDENKEDEFDEDSSEKKKRPDSIQMLAMNSQSQSNHLNLKRKFPFSSSQSQGSNDGKEFSFNNRKKRNFKKIYFNFYPFSFLEKKFKYMNDYQMNKSNKNILGNINIHGTCISPDTANSSNLISPDPIPQEPISIGKYLNCSDHKENIINDMEIQEEDNQSVKSNDTDDQLDFTELIAPEIEYTRNTIIN